MPVRNVGRWHTLERRLAGNSLVQLLAWQASAGQGNDSGSASAAPLTGRGAGAQPQDVAPRRLPDAWSLRGLLFNASTRLWDRGLTPGTVVRTLGPLGPGLISKYARNRCRLSPLRPARLL